MSHIFISHAVADGADKANAMVAALEAAGHTCWIAPRDVTAGRTYPAQIMAAVRDSGGLILIATPAANESPDVLQEVNLGHSHRKTIVPVMVDGTQPSDDLAYYLSVRHQLPWTDPSALLPAILRALPLPEGAEATIAAPKTGAQPSGPKAMSPTEAIAAAAASEDGVTGVFEFVVVSSAFDEGVYWLNSEADYRDPRCLAAILRPKFLAALQARNSFIPSVQVQPQIFEGRSVRFRGTAHKRRIDFISGGKPTGHYYFQTHVEIDSADDIEFVE